jgi:hypothetical protein
MWCLGDQFLKTVNQFFSHYNDIREGQNVISQKTSFRWGGATNGVLRN